MANPHPSPVAVRGGREMSTEVFAAIRKLGMELTPPMIEGSMGVYAPLVPRPDPTVCKVERDLVYGPDARHRLDVFQPVSAGAHLRPVVAFVHGGGFVRGDKGAPDAPFYNNVGVWAVQNGLVGVTLTYRLAPGATWPAGPQDVASAVEWLGENVSRYGGDPARIFVMGQSAGAAHVAGYVAGHHGQKPGTRIAGAMMMSGLYDLLALKLGPFEEAYFGSDRSRIAAASTVEALANTELPCLFSVAELDPHTFQNQAIRLVDAHWAAKGRWPRMLYLHGHNHISPMLQLGSRVDTLGHELLEFIRSPAGEVS